MLQLLHYSLAQRESCLQDCKVEACASGALLGLAATSGSVLSAVLMGFLLLALWNYLRTTRQVRLLWLIMVQVSQTSLRSPTTRTAT